MLTNEMAIPICLFGCGDTFINLRLGPLMMMSVVVVVIWDPGMARVLVRIIIDFWFDLGYLLIEMEQRSELSRVELE
jgi:hypothetical protein